MYEIALATLDAGPIYCVWSGRRLAAERLDIDHRLPWSAWACNDLWNLMPCDPRVNQTKKRERLPSAGLLRARAGPIQSWWQDAYVEASPVSAGQFYTEAKTSLPAPSSASVDVVGVFAGLQSRRFTIWTDTQVAKWEG